MISIYLERFLPYEILLAGFSTSLFYIFFVDNFFFPNLLLVNNSNPKSFVYNFYLAIIIGISFKAGRVKRNRP